MGTDPKNLLGTTLSGRYRIDKAIGEGGMGAIFQATQLSLGRAVAIKVVKSVHEDNSDAVRRFELETEVIARLAHPNIVQVVDAGKADDGTMYLAMELLQGDSVRQVLRKVGTLPVARALAIVEDIASALAAAHAGGVIHRDLKAENVMLVKAAGKQEIAKVLDFGVAKLTTKTEAPPQTGSGFVAGTPGCIAPEQMLGKSDEPRSDLYSVGVLLFEMLAGEPPFVSTSSVELMMRHLTEPAPHVADVARALGRPEVPGPVDELVTSLLAKDPDKRPRSAEALIEIVSTLRDAGRSTQPDLRAPTPMGGFGVPTPGSVSMPTATGATPIPFGAPSGAVVTQKPVTAPTTTVPVPHAPTEIVARKRPIKKAAVAAVLVALFVVVPGAGMWLYEKFADRAIPGTPWLERESWRRFNAMDEALLKLDLDVVKNNARFLLHEKQQDVPIAWLFLAQVAILERQPLSVVDGFDAQARASAERRTRAKMGSRRHTELLVASLTEGDPVKARALWQAHLEEGGCTDAFVEEHMFAQRLMFTEMMDGQKIVDAFEPLIQRYPSHAFPFSRIGKARGLVMLSRGETGAARQKRLDEAEAIIAPLLAARPLNVPLIDAMVDVDLARGNRAAALQRIDTHLAEEDDPRLNIRRAVIRLSDDPNALAGMSARLESLPDANPMKTLGFAFMGHAHASRGQLKEADEMWQRSKASAVGADAPSRIAELAVFASLFAATVGDVDVAKRWLDEYQMVRDGVPEGPGSRRVKAVALSNRIILAAEDMREPNAVAAARDFAWLRAEPIDIPLLTSTIDWHASVAQGKLDEAGRVAAKLPPCWKDIHVGITAAMQAAHAETGHREKFAAAAELLRAATTKDAEVACTTGDDVVSFIQAVEHAKALGWLATASCVSDDRKGAADALKRVRAFWPHASSPSPSPRWLAYVEAVEAWVKAPPGRVSCLPPKPKAPGAPEKALEKATPPARP